MITIKDATNIITIADKNLGANIVYNYWDTLSANNCGGFFQRWNNYMFPFSGASTKSGTQVNATWYWPWNYYNSSTFITATRWDNSANYDLRWNKTWVQKKWNVKQVYVGTTIARPTYNPWIYWNKAKWLISISSDWKNWITIADKNVGAKVVYNDWDTLSQDNCWYYYQWGNNYGFPYTWTISSTSTTAVNAGSYWPTNPYYSSTFIKSTNWDSSYNKNLWGITTNTLVARQWPCPTGFHVPICNGTNWFSDLIQRWVTLGAWTSTGSNEIKKYLKMPFAWNRSYQATVWNQGSVWWYICSEWDSTRAYQVWYKITSTVWPNNSNRWTAYSIRPFKNDPVVPDNSRTVLYQPS